MKSRISSGELVGQRDQEALVEELDTSSVRVHREADAL